MVDREEEEEATDEEGESTLEVNFKHGCGSCGHIIAPHFYREVASPKGCRYLMECMLCGKGAHEKVIMQYAAVSTGSEDAAASGIGLAGDDEAKKVASSRMFAAAAEKLPRPPPKEGALGGAADEGTDVGEAEWGECD